MSSFRKAGPGHFIGGHPVLRSGLTEACTHAEAFQRGLCVPLGDGQVSSHLCGCRSQLASAPASSPAPEVAPAQHSAALRPRREADCPAPSRQSPPQQPGHLGGPQICLSSVSPPVPCAPTGKLGRWAPRTASPLSGASDLPCLLSSVWKQSHHIFRSVL